MEQTNRKGGTHGDAEKDSSISKRAEVVSVSGGGSEGEKNLNKKTKKGGREKKKNALNIRTLRKNRN